METVDNSAEKSVPVREIAGCAHLVMAWNPLKLFSGVPNMTIQGTECLLLTLENGVLMFLCKNCFHKNQLGVVLNNARGVLLRSQSH